MLGYSFVKHCCHWLGEEQPMLGLYIGECVVSVTININNQRQFQGVDSSYQLYTNISVRRGITGGLKILWLYFNSLCEPK